MSQENVADENVAVVLASYETYNAGDLDALMGFYASDVDALPDSAVFPESAPLHGLIEFRAWLEEIGSAWVSPRYLTREVFAVGRDRVLLRGDWGGAGATSGIETYSSITGILTVREGKIARVEYFFDHGKALKALGLAE
jgi:ketosteroid isomerase-like protein